MKQLIAIALALTSLGTLAPAVTWDLVAVSVVVKQGNNQGNITTTVINNRKYLQTMAARFAVAQQNLFIGFREDTGQISVVDRSTQTVLYNIVSGLTTQGNASNGTATTQSIAVSATVSSLNTDFTGFALDRVSRSASGAIRSVSRSFFGGSGNQTLKGIAVATGRKIEL